MATLLGFLDYQRATLAWKCSGLNAEGLRATTAASTMTLGGILKHMALVEDGWFSRSLHGREYAPPWDAVDWTADRDWEWHTAAEDSPEELFALWQRAVQQSRAAVAEVLDRGDGLGRLAKRTWPDGRAYLPSGKPDTVAGHSITPQRAETLETRREPPCGTIRAADQPSGLTATCRRVKNILNLKADCGAGREKGAASRIANMKELRPPSAGRSEIRILLVFDPWRSVVLLVAGDKSGQWDKWYRTAIPRAEQLYDDYLAERSKETGP